MSSIRVTYSGLIALIVGLVSVSTGLVFTLIVTRRLAPEEFGLWAIIGNMISYFLISELIISYWSTRQVARGEQVGKTALFTSSVFAIVSIPIYIFLGFQVANVSPSHLNSLILGVVLLPVYFISQTLTAINLGHKPQANSYGLMVFESTKIPSALALVYFLDLGIQGAILATLAAFLIKIGIQMYFARSKIRNKIELSLIKKWFKLSWISIYNDIGSLVYRFDVLVYAIVTGSVLGVAFYAASVTVTQLIAHSSLIYLALYPKLIGKGSQDHISENFNLLLYFAIPLVGITVIFSKPALFTLNPAYQDAVNVVIIMSLATFFYVLTNFFHRILLGIERIDEKEDLHPTELLKSKLFLSPTLKNIHYVSYFVVLVAFLALFVNTETKEIEMVVGWAGILLVHQIIFFGILLFIAKKNVTFNIQPSKIIKYIGATIGFTGVFLITSDFLIVYHESIFDFLPGVILQLLICVSVYLGITFLIDKKIRKLFYLIIKEVR